MTAVVYRAGIEVVPTYCADKEKPP